MINVRLNSLLAARGITLEEFSERTDWSYHWLKTFASGSCKQISLTSLNELCRELNCSTNDILEYTAD